jgi:hypothetical protein
MHGTKHKYWTIPALVAIAYIFGPVGSLPLSIFFHWLRNTI